ncbi:Ig-like domain-containing protein [Flavobacterium sp. SM2513]|uniref:Ig-like domain-containing protein n=1 Tax=Flavobacterium sp. SM2513 TaxID=3424766 RepID=UPI003D7F4B89
MKKLLFLLLVGFLSVSGFAQDNLARWVSSNFSATADNSHVTASNISVNGQGVSLTSVENWGADNIFYSTTPGTFTTVINTAQYRQFEIKANTGYTVTPSSFNFKGRIQSESSKIVIRYSKSADFNAPGTFMLLDANTSPSYINYDLSFPANYTSDAGGSIYVRVYIYNTNNNFHFGYQPGTYDGPTFKGTVAAVSVTAVNDVINISKNTVSEINVLNNDFPGNGTFTTVGSLTTPTNGAGTVSVNADKTIKFTATTGFVGTSTFNYTVSNSAGGSSQALVSITITEPALVEWGLTNTTTTAVTNQQTFVTANAVQITGSTPSYSIAGMALANFTETDYAHGRYFDLKVKPTTDKPINLTNLVFEQERLTSGSLAGPTNYQIKYKVVTGAFSDSDYQFYANATVLIAGESIVSNPVKNIPLNITLTSNQTLVVRFYAKGATDYNFAGWRIKANTLKLRGNEVCVTQGTPTAYSDNFWTGYAYTWTGSAATNYLGYVKENETFNRNVGSSSITGGVDGTTYLCSTPSDQFFVRYRMRKTFPSGSYTFTVGGDDGYRMSIDGGATWLIEDYTAHAYSTKSASACFDGVTPTLLVIEYFENYGNSQVSFTYAATTAATAPTAVSTSATAVCAGSSFTLTASGGTGTIYQWGTGNTIGSNIITGQTAATITLSQTQPTTYWVRRVKDACTTGFTAGVTIAISLQAVSGDPTVFGNNIWNVYGYNAQSMTPTLANYRGYYTQNTLGCDTQDTANNGWVNTTSPSSSAGWNGCQVPNDSFTMVHKRKGFPAGSYQLIVKNYDDTTQIFINGVQVRNYTTWYGGSANYQDDLGIYCLNANSTIEVITNENTSLANFKLNIVASSAVYSGTTWSNGVNPANKSVEIQNDLSLNDDLIVCSCTIKTGTTLTITENKTLTVIGDVTVEGTGKIIVENNGSFIQINDNAAFTGATDSFLMKRNTQPVFKYDYTYWSSPVKPNAGFTLNALSPLTTPTRYMKWKHTGTPQAWEVLLNGSEVMVPGRGYIVRAPATFNVEGAGAAQVYNAGFIGHPNNGVITHDVTGSITANAFNLIGNPYPSAIDAAAFLAANTQTFGGTLYFWTHNTAFSNATNFSYTPSDYATWNGTGSTATSAGDASNNNLSKPTGYIAAGQAFFVQGIGDGAGTATFNNTMRIAGNNNQFFKPLPTQPVDNWQTTGKHRVWLNLTSAQNDFNQALVGYIENATNEMDRNFDGEVFSGGSVSLYSILGAKKLTIQGRALPFSNQDEVPLGYKTTLTGTLKISIAEIDGLLAGQNIYIKDNVLDIVHNLKDSDYTFATVPGTFDQRFVLRYLPQETLGTDEPTINANSIVVFNSNNQINIKSSEHSIKQVDMYDLQGRLLFSKNNVNQQTFTTQNLNLNSQVILVKITTDNDGVLIKKVMLN